MSVSPVFASDMGGATGSRSIDVGGAGEMNGKRLDAREQQEVRELKRSDAEVKRHEQAHLSAAGSYARGGAQFEYRTGPDGKRYAVSGEVRLDTSKVPNDPDATLRKAETIKRAALAPADPSQQDRRVAAEASQMEAEAREEIATEKRDDSGTLGVRLHGGSGQPDGRAGDVGYDGTGRAAGVRRAADAVDLFI